MEIERNQEVICGWCNGDSTAGEWSDNTFAQCTSRKHRRAFRALDTDARFNRASKFYYKCPKCGMWSRGDQLNAEIEIDGTRKVLGGAPIIKLLHRKDADNPFI